MFNWKEKFRNKAFVITLTMAVIAFIYQLLGIIGIVPKVSQDTVTNVVMLLINLLTSIGIIVNPNTDGISD